MIRSLLVLLAFAAVLTACGGTEFDTSGVADLPHADPDELEATLANLDRPAVVNVWASWCIPCRSEAPLLTAAHEANGDQIEFIGVDVQDSQESAKEFIVEFDIAFANYFDPNRSIPARYGGIGTPLTYFFGPGGELLSTHNGVIDERTLALGIDELLRLDS